MEAKVTLEHIINQTSERVKFLLVSLEKNYLNICTKMNSSVILVVQSIMGLATIILMDMSGCVIDK